MLFLCDVAISQTPDDFNPGPDGTVYSLSVQPDGKILTGGFFKKLAGASRVCIGRLNADGKLDTNFTASTDGTINALVLQDNGKILAGGSFTAMGGKWCPYIARLASDGSLDTSMNPSVYGYRVNSLVQQSDGKIVLGGDFDSILSEVRRDLARLNPDGTLDASFATFESYSGESVQCMAMQTDGKILVEVNFRLARLNTDGSLDPTFHPIVDGLINTLVVQPDGNILIGGRFNTVCSQTCTNIARLSSGGELDTTFNPSAEGVQSSVHSLALQADGKIIVGGSFLKLAGENRSRLGRLNVDGSLDKTFAPGVFGDLDLGTVVYSMAIQADGKLLVGGSFNLLGGQARTNLGRIENNIPATQNLTYDGSEVAWMRGGSSPEVWRTTFETTTNGIDWIRLGEGVRTPEGWRLNGVSLPPQSTIRARGFATSGYHNGSSCAIESYGLNPLLICQPTSRTINTGSNAMFSIQAFGQSLQFQWLKNGIVISNASSITGAQSPTLTLTGVQKSDEGNYTVIVTSGSLITTSAVARLLVNNPYITTQPSGMEVQRGSSATLRIAAGGTVPLSYQWLKNEQPLSGAINPTLFLQNVQHADAGEYSVVVRNSIGSTASAVAVVTVFTPLTVDTNFNAVADYGVECLSTQLDGKIVISGVFDHLNGQPQSNLGRLNNDGTLDTFFNPRISGPPTVQLHAVAIQPDGKIVVGGWFTNIAGVPRNRIGRLNRDGTLDSTFNPGADQEVNCIAPQSDGKILVGGRFSMLGGQTRKLIARLNSDGSPDADFTPETDGYPSAVYAMAFQPDGKILLGGTFSSLCGQRRSGIGRLNPDGSLDSTFNPDGSSVFCLALQPDGKILVGGNFITFGGQPRYFLCRLNSDGTLDTTFNTAANQFVESLILQADGRILVSGHFTTLGEKSRNYLGRLFSDGALDTTFNPGANASIFSLGIQPDGNIVAGGEFTSIGGKSKTNIARLINTISATQSLTFDGSKLLWQRGGSSPEVSQTTFAVTTDGLNWTNLGNATRSPSGFWQLSGVSLPKHYTVRARGFVSDGAASWWPLDAYIGDIIVACQPLSRTNNSGTTITFAVTTGGGSETAVYQWLKNGEPISNGERFSGAQTVVLTITNALKADEGAYSLVIYDETGTVTSLPAQLVIVDPFIITQPANQDVQLAENVTLNVVAGGSSALCYKWLKDDCLLDGSTNATHLITNAQGTDAGNYSVIVWNSYGSVTSAVAHLSVNLAAADTNFSPNPTGPVSSLAVQPNGKILVGGSFPSICNVTSTNLARLDPSGALDANFNSSANSYVHSFAVLGDESILVAGTFDKLNDQSCSGLGRLGPDGKRDGNFKPSYSSAYSLALQLDGKLLVTGGFSIKRFNSNGSPDSFYTSMNGSGATLLLQEDGKILAGGGFTTLGGQSRSRIGRLCVDGTLDTTFNPGANDLVLALAMQPDGRILVGGRFTNLAGATRYRIGRLNPDGSLDTSFTPEADKDVNCLVLQADGKILVGGYFSVLSGQQRKGIARLNPDGSLDTFFNPGAGFSITTIALEPDGKILVGGSFNTLSGQPRINLGRLLNNIPATQSLTYDRSKITWLRGGSSPEVWRTTFDVSTDGASWTDLGPGKRIPGGWELSGISLPIRGTIRARGFTCSGKSSGLVETLWQPPSLSIAPNGIDQHSLKLMGNPGQTVELHTGTNLSGTWTSVGTFILTNPLFVLPWTNQRDPARFFKLQPR